MATCIIVGFTGGFVGTKIVNNKEIKDASAYEQPNNVNVGTTTNTDEEDQNSDKNTDQDKDKKKEPVEKVDKEAVIKDKNYSLVGQPFVDSGEIVNEYIYGKKIPEKKVAYLTFDDGPSRTNTPKVLDILKQNDVKGTFFIVGSQLEEEQDNDIVRRIVKEGHAIGNHTYSHDYDKIYPGRSVNKDAFMQEVHECDEKLRGALGDGYKTTIVRMPGGHMSWKNTQELDEEFKKDSISSIDWNCINGDGEYKNRSEDQMFEYFKETAEGHTALIILMHDSYGKEKTVNILPRMIDYLKSQGYEFRTIG